MASTYINNLRLEEIGTGEASGTWGTKTNTNLSLIGKALGYATEAAFSSDANATTTVADGADDPARAMYYKVTSGATLTTTRQLTIAPDTISRVMLIENATTGSQSITIKQGSGGGAAVTIPTGAVKLVFLDGGGSAAIVEDGLAGLDLTGTTTAVDVTASGTVTTANVTVSGIVSVADGSAGAPSITNTGDTNCGLFFSAADTLSFTAGGTAQVNFSDGLIAPETNNDVDLGSSSKKFKDAYFDGSVTTDQVDILAEGDLRLQDASGGEYVAIEAPATIGSSYTLQLPAADGSSGQTLTTNGSGVLSFSTIAAETTPVTGSLTVTDSNATYTVTGVGFTPSLIHFVAYGGDTVATPGGSPGQGADSGYYGVSTGFATGTASSNQTIIASRVQTDPSTQYAVVLNNGYVWWINNYDGNMNLGTLSAIGSDGFTVTTSVLYGTTCKVQWTCFK